MSIDIAGIVAAVQSHAQAAGSIETVVTSEPKSAPGTGISAAIWVSDISPAGPASGLAAMSVVLTLMVRVMKPMVSQPYGQIDSDLLEAVDELMTAYAGAFTLGGEVRNVDLFGMYGSAMAAKAGYLQLDKGLLRVMDITLPLVLDDVWAEVA